MTVALSVGLVWASRGMQEEEQKVEQEGLSRKRSRKSRRWRTGSMQQFRDGLGLRIHNGIYLYFLAISRGGL